MQRALLVLVLAVVLSGATSFLVATSLRPDAGPQAAAASPDVTIPDDLVRSAELRELQDTVDRLAMEVSSLRRQRASSSGPSRSAAGVPDVDRRREPAGSSATDSSRVALAANVDVPDALRAQVAAVLDQIEEEREAEEWEEELEERREEAVEANEEYAEFDELLESRLVDLRDELGLAGDQVRTLRGVLAVQNERNREMTRLWSAGETSDEELERMYYENRTEHRRDVRTLLGEEQLESYRAFMREGGLGDRFSFFVSPWEEWEYEDER